MKRDEVERMVERAEATAYLMSLQMLPEYISLFDYDPREAYRRGVRDALLVVYGLVDEVLE